VTYEILNALTTNTIAAFTSEEDAWTAYKRLTHEQPEYAEHLAVVVFDDAGEALQMLAGPQVAERA
jgi:hypothetical protein